MTMLNFVIMLALVATMVALGSGIWSMAHGGQFDDKHSEHFMYARVGLQGLVVFLLLLASLLSYSS